MVLHFACLIGQKNFGMHTSRLDFSSYTSDAPHTPTPTSTTTQLPTHQLFLALISLLKIHQALPPKKKFTLCKNTFQAASPWVDIH
jgi:hypothetical protein